MEHQHKTRGFGGIINDGTWWYTMGVWGKLILLYFKKRSDKVNLLIRCLMSPCFKIIQVAVCGPWCPLRWPQPLRICYPSKSTLNLERWLWNALDHHFQIARKCTFLGLHVRHVRCFWVYSNILALSLSLMTLFMHKKDHSLDSLTPRIPCPASRHLSVLNHEFVLPGVVPAQNWDAGRMTCNLTHLTNPWLGWPKCKPTQLSKPPPCHPGLSSRSRTLLPISKSSPLSW